MSIHTGFVGNSKIKTEYLCLYRNLHAMVQVQRPYISSFQFPTTLMLLKGFLNTPMAWVLIAS